MKLLSWWSSKPWSGRYSILREAAAAGKYQIIAEVPIPRLLEELLEHILVKQVCSILG